MYIYIYIYTHVYIQFSLSLYIYIYIYEYSIPELPTWGCNGYFSCCTCESQYPKANTCMSYEPVSGKTVFLLTWLQNLSAYPSGHNFIVNVVQQYMI